jgi:hypothetical protein
LFVIGGLYGNQMALEAVKQRISQEAGPVHVCFNGDFNFMNTDEKNWDTVNREILFANPTWQAILGNVEYEAAVAPEFSGCGCGYPSYVSEDVQKRSDLIVGQLRQVANSGRPDIRSGLRSLPLFRVYGVAGLRVGVIHGDPESLAGWGLAPETTEPDVPELQAALGVGSDHPRTSVSQLRQWLADANVDIFASTHTCIPFAQRIVDAQDVTCGLYFNNGAAGMGNFNKTTTGLITRISTKPDAPKDSLYGTAWKGLRCDAVPLSFDGKAFYTDFQSRWPSGSHAALSYGNRVRRGLPYYTVAMANRL